MVQGSASGVGKSVIATALCSLLADEGWHVAPFKAQNMSNNAAVTADGGEIGRAQAAQAEAAGIEPTVDMNPILLKPEADDRSQLVVCGRAVGSFGARDYWARRASLWAVVRTSLRTLRQEYDVVVIEGAGSPAELNLRRQDIANMRVARHAQAKVLLVGDIERGGIFAQLLGTLDLLPPAERDLVAGLLVNRFRGDPSLFAAGAKILARRARIPVVGILPYDPLLRVPAEDSMSLDGLPSGSSGELRVAMVAYPRVSNFDDLDPLRWAGVAVDVVRRPDQIGVPDLVVLPGSKATIADLDWMRRSGVATAVVRAADAGVPILGICGGFQMLGERLDDPDGLEGSGRAVAAGLGLLPIRTLFTAPKSTRRVTGEIVAQDAALFPGGTHIDGYEIHMGMTDLGTVQPLAWVRTGPVSAARPDGAVSRDGLVMGTYVHGLFGSPAVMDAVRGALQRRRGWSAPHEPSPPVNSLATWFRMGADVQRILEMIRATRDRRLPRDRVAKGL
ncbi:MAG: cobyric acid synthase [Candidatus Limnocylindria bacterium]